MLPSVSHSILNTKFIGVEDRRYGSTVHHFRGIPYGRIPERFARPQKVSTYERQRDATQFGYWGTPWNLKRNY